MRLRAITPVWTTWTILLLWILFPTGVLHAQVGEEEVSFRTHYYRDNHGLTVKSPMVIVRKTLSEKTLLSLKYTYETFEFSPKTSASSGIGATDETHEHEKPESQKAFFAVDAVSSASAVRQGSGGGFKEVRQEVVFGLKHQFENTSLGGTYAHSDEDDYTSNAVGISVSRDFFLRNTNLLAAFSRSEDQLDSLNPRPGEVWPKDKKANHYTLVLTQLLSPKSFVRIGAALSDVSGTLSSPYREVTISATSSPEVHPDIRLRQSYFAWYNRYYETRTSSHINGTYYQDDWGVTAHSAELKVYQYLLDPLILRLRYRVYSQSRADFYNPDRTRPANIMSADPKLRDFDMDLYGLKFIYQVWNRPVRTLKQVSLELGYDRLEEPHGFYADLAQFALRIIF